jgi:hypothetical protein
MGQESAPPSGSAAIDGDHFSVVVSPDGFEVRKIGEPHPFCVGDVERLVDLGNVLAIAQDYANGEGPGSTVPRIVFVTWTGKEHREVFKTWGQPPQIKAQVSLPGLDGVYEVSAVRTSYGEHGQVQHRVSVFDSMRLVRGAIRTELCHKTASFEPTVTITDPTGAK